jgi:hypothetical protein
MAKIESTKGQTIYWIVTKNQPFLTFSVCLSVSLSLPFHVVHLISIFLAGMSLPRPGRKSPERERDRETISLWSKQHKKSVKIPNG